MAEKIKSSNPEWSAGLIERVQSNRPLQYGSITKGMALDYNGFPYGPVDVIVGDRLRDRMNTYVYRTRPLNPIQPPANTGAFLRNALQRNLARRLQRMPPSYKCSSFR